MLVKVKWSKEVFSVEAEGAVGLKRELERVTGVPVARQKLLAKGAWVGVLKDDTSLSKLKPSQQVTLIGSAEVVVKPSEEAKFVEDMDEAEKARSGTVLPAGLENLGNTCYMNSTLQCLRAVPEFRRCLVSSAAAAPSNPFPRSLHATFEALDSSTKAVAPMLFVQALRESFPQFAQRGRGGGYAQQDAEELYSTLLATTLGSNNSGRQEDSVFGIELEDTLECVETDEKTRSTDTARKLVCNIQGGFGMPKVDTLQEGLKLALTGSIEKRSDKLGHDAAWVKRSRVSKPPPYLCVQFMRFFWKPTPGNDDHAGVKCKIMRPVAFPETLDLYELCSEHLQKMLKFNRDKFGAKLDPLFTGKAKQNNKDSDPPAAAAAAAAPDDNHDQAAAPPPPPPTGELPATADGDDAMQVDYDLAQAIALSMNESVASPPDFAAMGLPSDFTGDYSLFALVTHKGRSADGGHYMGWVRQRGDAWLVFDDDLVTESSTEFVINQLKGGGDEHMAYLAFYKAKSKAHDEATKAAPNGGGDPKKPVG